MDVADAEDLRGRSRGARELKARNIRTLKNRKNLLVMIPTEYDCILMSKVTRVLFSLCIDFGDECPRPDVFVTSLRFQLSI